MKWMRLFSSEPAPIVGQNLLDTLCGRLEKLMSFEPDQRDLVMLQHKFVIAWPDGTKVTLCFLSTHSKLMFLCSWNRIGDLNLNTRIVWSA